ADGLRIGKAIRAAPAASSETTPETPATAPPPGAAAADVEVKQAGVDIVQVAKNGKLHPLLEFAVRSRNLVPFLGTAAHSEVSEIAVVAVGGNLQVQHPLRIAGPVSCKVGLVTVIVYDLDFLHNLGRQVLDGRFDVATEKILSIDPRPRDGFALCGNVAVIIDFHAVQFLECISHQRTFPELKVFRGVFQCVFFDGDGRRAGNGHLGEHV